MTRGLAPYSAVEEAAYRRQEMLSAQATGLFSSSGRWFRASEYEIALLNERVYIRPKIGARVQSYHPFEEYPDILIAFIELVLDIRRMHREIWITCLDLPDEAKAKRWAEGFKDMGSRFLPFVNRYGPLGLVSEGYSEILQMFGPETGDSESRVVIPKWSVYAAAFAEDKIPQPLTLEYDEYVRPFFPTLSSPYPVLGVAGQEGVFVCNYSEPVDSIVLAPAWERLAEHVEGWAASVQQRGSQSMNPAQASLPPVEMCADPPTYALSTHVSMGLRFAERGRCRQIEWRYASLLGALSIMYILNLAGGMGLTVKVCQMEGCTKAFIGRGKYCCPEHGNIARVKRYRARQRSSKETDR